MAHASSSIIAAAEDYVKTTLTKADAGHDWHHIERVRRMALRIGREEKANLLLVELMALFHEVADYKIVGVGNEEKAYQKLARWLKKNGISVEDTDHILFVIKNQSFSVSGLSGTKLPSLEGRVMQDADRLEALGAMGIARCFMYNGKKGNPLYDPSYVLYPRTAQEYKKNQTPAINHFDEKLLKLAALMNTKTAKKIAHKRHRFMEQYLDEFYAEWEGKR